MVDASQQLVDRPLRPVDDLRVELLDDELKRIAVFAAHLFARGDATPFRLEGADKVADAAADSLRSEADSDEAEHAKHVLVDCCMQIRERGHNVGSTVLVAQRARRRSTGSVPGSTLEPSTLAHAIDGVGALDTAGCLAIAVLVLGSLDENTRPEPVAARRNR